MSCDCVAGRFILSVRSDSDTRCALSIGIWRRPAVVGIARILAAAPFSVSDESGLQAHMGLWLFDRFCLGGRFCCGVVLGVGAVGV